MRLVSTAIVTGEPILCLPHLPQRARKTKVFSESAVTGDGVREWQWYVRDPKSTMELVNRTLGELEPFPVEFTFQEDREWTVYGRFLELTGSAEGGL